MRNRNKSLPSTEKEAGIKVSIIIPTLNEEAYVSKTIQHLLKAALEPSKLEVIVVDAGSTDKTIASLEGLPIRIFERPDLVLKKYASLNLGIQQAAGEYLLFLDADTFLPQNFDQLIQSSLRKPGISGGAFEFSFYPWQLVYVPLVWFNRVRYRLDRIYYGDQGIFCTRQTAIEIGGFPKDQLMDTAFFCKKLKEKGKLALLKPAIRTSNRRFKENGFIRTCWFDLKMIMRFHFAGDTKEERESYWRFNLTADE